MTILAIYLGLGALLQGYFAETAFLACNAGLYAALFVLLYKRRQIVFTPAHGVLLLLTALYGIAPLYAVDPEQAVLEAGRMSGMLPLSLIAAMTPADKLERTYRMLPWIGAALVVTGAGFGLYRDGRLESLLQYANALAIVLLVAIVFGVVGYVQQRRPLGLCLLAVNAAGLLLTFSRAVWVLWLAAGFAALLWFSGMRQRRAWLHIGLAHLGGLALAMAVKRDPFFFWQRVASIHPGTSEFRIRLVYWKDSLGMIADHWWGGGGGGGWNVLLPLYRSEEYFVRYVHNHYVQTAVDIGVFGLLMFLLWLLLFYAASFRMLARSRGEGKGKEPLTLKGVIVAGACMTLHAGFDIDLSFPLLFGLLVLLAAYPRLEGRSLQFAGFGKMGAAAAVFLLAGVVWWSWLAAGYLYKREGNRLALSGRHPEAQAAFVRAERLLPWSSAVLYDAAKNLVLQGNAAGETAYYRLAADYVRRAEAKVPEQMLYRELAAQLETYKKRQ